VAQLVTRIDDDLANETDALVSEGVVKSRSDAVRPQTLEEVGWADDSTVRRELRQSATDPAQLAHGACWNRSRRASGDLSGARGIRGLLSRARDTIRRSRRL